MDTEIRAFFDRFVQDFPGFSGERIASRYAAPYMAIHADGSPRLLATPADVAAYFQGVLDDYRRMGCIGCRYEQLEAQPLGAHAALATVTWVLEKAGGQVLSSWRESYTLVPIGGELKVRASVDHAP